MVGWLTPVHNPFTSAPVSTEVRAESTKKAAAAAKSKKTIANLPKSTRTALGKQANKVKRER